MKIILKHGTALYHIHCPVCHCEFLYDPIDITLMENKDHRTYSEKVECPECGSWIGATRKKYNDGDVKL